MENLYLTVTNNIFSDLELTLKDTNTEIILTVHKHILYTFSPYFKNLLTNCKEATMNKILINVPNAYVCSDIIMSFYQKKICSGNYPVWKYLFECIKCYDFFGINYDYDQIFTIQIPSEGFEDLLEILPYLEENDKIYALIRKCMPADYDNSKLSYELLEKLVKKTTYYYSILCTNNDNYNSTLISYDIEDNSITNKLNTIINKKYLIFDYYYYDRNNCNNYLLFGNDTGDLTIYSSGKYFDFHSRSYIKNNILSLKISNNGEKIIVTTSTIIIIYSFINNIVDVDRYLHGDAAIYNGLFVDCSDNYFFVANTNEIKIWTFDNYNNIFTIFEPNSICDAYFLKNSNKIIYAVRCGSINIYDIDTNTTSVFFDIDTLNNIDGIISMSITDNLISVLNNKKKLFVFDINSKILINMYELNHKTNTKIIISPDNNYIMVSNCKYNNNRDTLINIGTGVIIDKYKSHNFSGFVHKKLFDKN